MLYIMLFLTGCYIFHYIHSNKQEKIHNESLYIIEKNISAAKQVETEIVI